MEPSSWVRRRSIWSNDDASATNHFAAWYDSPIKVAMTANEGDMRTVITEIQGIALLDNWPCC